MAASGSQKTRIGPGVPAVGIAVTIVAKAASGAAGRIMSSMANSGGLAGPGGIAGAGGGLAG